MIRVTVWSEHMQERDVLEVKSIYPDGINGSIAEFLGKEEDIVTRCANLHEPECGLSEEVLSETDVLIWWGHIAHDKVPDEIVDRVQNHVLMGMGMIFLHSAHHSKPFKRLMGTSCNLSWREDGCMERLWVIDPAHPITQGIDKYFELDHEEMYGEPFGIPEPQKVLFIGWYPNGEVFRSGCCYVRGNGKIFYFQPGHETFPIYYDKNVQTILKNAVRWAEPVFRAKELTCPMVAPPGRE